MQSETWIPGAGVDWFYSEDEIAWYMEHYKASREDALLLLEILDSLKGQRGRMGS